jgi:hypothetical protein
MAQSCGFPVKAAGRRGLHGATAATLSPPPADRHHMPAVMGEAQ